MTSQPTKNSIVPSKDSMRQLFIMVVAVAIVLGTYNHFFAAPDLNKEAHEKVDKALQQQIDDANERINQREEQVTQRIQEINELKRKLQLSKNAQNLLKTQLNDAKLQLQKATDSANVHFYTKYINEYRSNDSN